MNKNKYVFAQLIEFLDKDKFRHLVDKYNGNRYVKSFTCWNQLLALMFGQLSNRESLRDVVVALEAHHSKCYHLGMGRNPITKTTVIILEWGEILLLKRHLLQPTKSGIIAYLKTLHSL